MIQLFFSPVGRISNEVFPDLAVFNVEYTAVFGKTIKGIKRDLVSRMSSGTDILFDLYIKSEESQAMTKVHSRDKISDLPLSNNSIRFYVDIYKFKHENFVNLDIELTQGNCSMILHKSKSFSFVQMYIRSKIPNLKSHEAIFCFIEDASKTHVLVPLNYTLAQIAQQYGNEIKVKVVIENVFG